MDNDGERFLRAILSLLSLPNQEEALLRARLAIEGELKYRDLGRQTMKEETK